LKHGPLAASGASVKRPIDSGHVTESGAASLFGGYVRRRRCPVYPGARRWQCALSPHVPDATQPRQELVVEPSLPADPSRSVPA
jgi:hypothetical protein